MIVDNCSVVKYLICSMSVPRVSYYFAENKLGCGKFCKDDASLVVFLKYVVTSPSSRVKSASPLLKSE